MAQPGLMVRDEWCFVFKSIPFFRITIIIIIIIIIIRHVRMPFTVPCAT